MADRQAKNVGELRDCFAPPIPETALAIDLLDRAADALISGRSSEAAALIVEADMVELWDYFQKIAAKTIPEVHRIRTDLGAPPRRNGTGSRMPSEANKQQFYRMDGWRCRFCGVRVINPKAAKILNQLFPIEARLGSRNRDYHTAFLVLLASPDHVVPYQRGGTSELENMVTACQVCQYGRNHFTLEEVGFTDPRDRAAVIDGWDGLGRLLDAPLPIQIG